MMDKDYSGYYGSLLILKDELRTSHSIDFIEVLNARVKHVVPIYSYFFFKKIIENISPNVEINFLHYPLPLTAELEEQSDQTNNNLVLYFPFNSQWKNCIINIILFFYSFILIF